MRKTLIAVICAIVCLLIVLWPYMLRGAKASGPEENIPGTILLDSIENMYGPVKFDHAMHTFIAGSCGECHHQHQTELDCTSCHSLESSEFRSTAVNTFLACQICHGEFSADMPGMPGLKVAYHSQCFKCHRGIGNVGMDPSGCTEQCHVRKEG